MSRARQQAPEPVALLPPLDEDEMLAAEDFRRYEDERWGQLDSPIGFPR